LIVTGKGGAGRSAITAALALNAARRGRRVLALAMTDRSGLAGHLGMRDIGYAPQRIRPGLHIAAVSPPAALEEYLRLRLRVPMLGPATRAFRLLADTVPGIRETVVAGKAVYEAFRGQWDVVVADGPPIGQVAGFLRAPATIESLVPSGVVREQAAWMRECLVASGLVIASLPEELAALETRALLDALEPEPPVEIAAVAVNRVLEPLEGVGPGQGRVAEAALHHRRLVAAQAQWIDPEDITLPFVFGRHTPAEVAEVIADVWGSA